MSRPRGYECGSCGTPYNESNTYWRTGPRRVRDCLNCQRAKDRRRWWTTRFNILVEEACSLLPISLRRMLSTCWHLQRYGRVASGDQVFFKGWLPRHPSLDMGCKPVTAEEMEARLICDFWIEWDWDAEFAFPVAWDLFIYTWRNATEFEDVWKVLMRLYKVAGEVSPGRQRALRKEHEDRLKRLLQGSTRWWIKANGQSIPLVMASKQQKHSGSEN